MKIHKLLLVVGSVVFLSACGDDKSNRVYSDAWYDVYGNQCGGLRPGCDYFANGYKIYLTQDPHWDNGIPQDGVFGSITYTDVYGFNRNYMGYYWVSPNGIIYGDFDHTHFEALNGERSTGRNVVGDMARQETEFLKRTAKDFSKRYGLSEQTGFRISQALGTWPLLTHGRARTEKEVERITYALYGIGADKIKVSLARAEEGDTALLEKAIDEAALSWSTTPEVFKSIQKNWFSWAINSYRK